MKRPKQLPAVDRNSNRFASVPVGANMGPSGWFDDVVSFVQKAAPIAAQAIPYIASAV
jgi:hypothetical protein